MRVLWENLPGMDLAAAILESDEKDAIGETYELLPDDGFFAPVTYTREDSGTIVAEGDDFSILWSSETDVLSAWRGDIWLGHFDGGSLLVDPIHRGQGIGTALAAMKYLIGSGDNPQADLDEVGYSPGGLAACTSGYRLAVRLGMEYAARSRIQ